MSIHQWTRLLAGSAALALLGLGSSGAGETKTPEQWTAELQRYAAQPHLENDRPYGGADPARTPALRWADLLDQLPPPAEWPRLRAQLVEAANQAPAGPERARLQAGGWLLAYLQGDRAALLAALPEPSAAEPPATPVAEARAALRSVLAGTGDEPAPEQQVRQFEQELQAVEPVDLAAVKQLLGSEENLARVNRLLTDARELQAGMAALYEEFQRTKDEAAVREKAEKLQQAFAEKHAGDEAALEPFRENPLLARYAASFTRPDGAADEQFTPSARIPDLVTFAGRERAEGLLRRAVRLRLRLSVDDQTGAETRRLARALALAAGGEATVPSWGLTQDLDGAELFDTWRGRFPRHGSADDYDYQRAAGYRLLAHIRAGEVAGAVELAEEIRRNQRLELPYDVLNALESGGQAAALWGFLHEWISRHPASDEWDRFNRLSAQLDRVEDLRKLVRSLAENGSFGGLDRLQAQRLQAGIELAADDLAAAARRLGDLVQAPAATEEEHRVQFDLAVKLMRLAVLQEDRAGFDRAWHAAEAIMAAEPAGGSSVDQAVTLASELNEAGRWADVPAIARAAQARAEEAERARQEKFAAELKASGLSAEEQAAMAAQSRALPDYQLRGLLAEELRALVELQRWEEAAKLLSDHPGWGVAEAGQLLTHTVRSNGRPIGHYLALVARHQQRDELARGLLEADLVRRPGADSLYQDYVDLAGKEALPLFARLAASDRYQERPLIWRARLELDDRQWARAAATLQEAIAIDPSDGEEGRGDRMRVYALLSEALAGQGDPTRAAFFAGVVQSIRLSETADRWFDLGAYARAIGLYRRALGFFQDAYCIQSRLAVRLANEGRMDEAAEHYRRAFELMPDSFGRVESHCFGCEHVFAGQKSQGVAEKVFTRMLAARPDKPQLHYLMGYLRAEQERWEEAAGHYREAVRLDPLYLNAWDRLAGLEQRLRFSAQERDDLLLKLLELDPLRRHATPSLDKVTDLARLWQAMQAARAVVAALPAGAPRWELTASAQRLAGGVEPDFPDWSERQSRFGSVLAQHPFAERLQRYFAALNANAEPN